MCLCGEYNSISSKTFLINARVDASPFSWEEISNILTGMRRRRCRFNSWIEPIQSTSILPCLKKERKEEGNQQESNKLSYLSTHPSHYYSFFRKNRDDLSKNLFFYFFLSFSFPQNSIARIGKNWPGGRGEKAASANVRARVRRVFHSWLIAARRNKIGSSRWRQVIGAGIDASLVKPGCISPSKRG